MGNASRIPRPLRIPPRLCGYLNLRNNQRRARERSISKFRFYFSQASRWPIKTVIALIGRVIPVQLVLSNLMSVLLLAHATLGCCWHHAHAGGTDDAAASAKAEVADDHCPCHRHSHHPLAPIPLPENCHHECMVGSEFLTVTRVQTENLRNSLFAYIHLSVDLSFQAQDLTFGGGWQPQVDTVLIVPPLRVHLLNQVILI